MQIPDLLHNLKKATVLLEALSRIERKKKNWKHARELEVLAVSVDQARATIKEES